MHDGEVSLQTELHKSAYPAKTDAVLAHAISEILNQRHNGEH